MLRQMGLRREDDEIILTEDRIRITGRTVNLRKGPGTGYGIAGVAEKGEQFIVAKSEGWLPVETANGVCRVSERYAESA